MKAHTSTVDSKRSWAYGYGVAAVACIVLALWLFSKGRETGDGGNYYGLGVLALIGALALGLNAWSEYSYARMDKPYLHGNRAEEGAEAEDEAQPQSGDVIETVMPAGDNSETDEAKEKPGEIPLKFDENVRVTF